MAEEEEVEVPSLKGEPARNESFGLFFFFLHSCHLLSYLDIQRSMCQKATPMGVRLW